LKVIENNNMVFVKGKSGNPKGKPIGIKNKETLLMEERRAIFDKEASQMWLETIKKLKPEYLADQFMGKAPDKIEHSGEIKTSTPIPKEALDIIESDLKSKKVS
jgi:hypothetical protein